MASRFGRSTPDPRFGSSIELRRCHLHGLLNLIGVGKTLASQRIAAEDAPPAFLEVEPTGPFGNEDLPDAWVLSEPGACFQAIVTAQIVCNDEDLPLGIVRFDGLEQLNVVFGIARSRTVRDLLAIADA